MRCYLAGRYAEKNRLNQLASQLRELGVSITSSWLEEAHPPESKLKDIDRVKLPKYPQRDLDDIDAADILIFFSEDPDTATVRGGRHVEFGYALAKGKPILVVGPLENIFHYLSNRVSRVTEWKEAKRWLKQRMQAK